MKQKPKAKASKSRATRNHRRRRNPVEVNVRPVALQASDSPDAVIPAVVKSDSDSPQAIISVEVNRGKSRRKRAAVIPISIKKGPARSDDRQRQREQSSARDDNRWSDPITDSVVSITNFAQGLVHLAHDFGFAVVNTAELLSQAIFSRATVVASAAERGQLDELDLGTVVRNPRRAEIQLRAA